MNESLDIHALPIKAFVRKTKFPQGYYVGKAGIQFRNWKNKWEYLFGFSINKDENLAKQIASYELLERLLARYEIQSKIRQNIDEFEKYAWPSWEVQGICKSDQIFIGNSPVSPTGVEASGLALRKSKEEAAEHAILELLERHLCSKIWYTEDFPLFEVKSYISFPGYNIHFYTVSNQELPFVIAEIISEESRITTFGHAIRNTYTEASQKALSEALMLLDCLLYEDNGMCSNERTKNRIFSLRGDIALERHSFIKSKVVSAENSFSEQSFSAAEIAKWVIGRRLDVSIVPLFHDEKICVVRAVSPEVETLASRRFSKNDNSTLTHLDPFC